MKTPHLTILILLSCWMVPAQYNSASKTQNWNNIISISKMEGTHTSGVQFSYLKNNDFWWGKHQHPDHRIFGLCQKIYP